jgi:hypothetical protein
LWERLPAEHERRFDLLEVAADFHRAEPLVWLFRDATEIEREAFAAFAIERRLADSLLLALENGLAPWANRTWELAMIWPVAVGVEFCGTPRRLSLDRGWILRVDGGVSSLRCEVGEWEPARRHRQRVQRLMLPRRVTGLASRAFLGCPRLTEVSLPSGLESIGSRAFSCCTGLTRISDLRTVTVVKAEAFWESGLVRVTLPKVVGSSAFEGCLTLMEVRIPAGVTTIGERAFARCQSLITLSIPPTVVNVGWWAFRDCESLTDVDFQSGSTLPSIGTGLLYGCTNLIRFTFPEAVVSIQKQAFMNGTKLEDVVFPPGVTSIGSRAFDGCGLKRVVLPARLQRIGIEAFGHCIALAELVIPGSVASVGWATSSSLRWSELLGQELSPALDAVLRDHVPHDVVIIDPVLNGRVNAVRVVPPEPQPETVDWRGNGT